MARRRAQLKGHVEVGARPSPGAAFLTIFYHTYTNQTNSLWYSLSFSMFYAIILLLSKNIYSDFFSEKQAKTKNSSSSGSNHDKRHDRQANSRAQKALGQQTPINIPTAQPGHDRLLGLDDLEGPHVHD